MNICLVSQEYPPDTVRGGIGVQTWNKAHSLAGLGHTVHVLSCAAEPGPDLATKVDSDVVVHRMQPPGVEFPIYDVPAYWLGYTWHVLRHLTPLMEKTAFDVIDFPEYGAEGFAYQIDRTPWNWAPVVVQLHAPLAMFAEHIGWPDKKSEFYRVGTFMEGVSIRRADGLMACSKNIADFTSRFYDIPRESIDVVHCGVDIEAFFPVGARERSGDRPTVLFVGNIAGNKGVQTLLEAVLLLRSNYPEILLRILGKGDDDLVSDMQARLCKEGAEANVEFVGFIHRERLPAYYRGADVFCSPAQYEGGAANVYLEAMACGCPVVASAVGGAPEAVRDGVTGLLTPPNDVEAVAAALDRILSDTILRGRMGDAGRKWAEEYFALDRYIDRVLATYRRAITRSQQTLNRLNTETKQDGDQA